MKSLLILLNNASDRINISFLSRYSQQSRITETYSHHLCSGLAEKICTYSSLDKFQEFLGTLPKIATHFATRRQINKYVFLSDKTASRKVKIPFLALESVPRQILVTSMLH